MLSLARQAEVEMGLDEFELEIELELGLALELGLELELGLGLESAVLGSVCIAGRRRLWRRLVSLVDAGLLSKARLAEELGV